MELIYKFSVFTLISCVFLIKNDKIVTFELIILVWYLTLCYIIINVLYKIIISLFFEKNNESVIIHNEKVPITASSDICVKSALSSNLFKNC